MPILFLGVLYMTKQRQEDAVKTFETLIRKDPKTQWLLLPRFGSFRAEGLRKWRVVPFRARSTRRQTFAPAYYSLGVISEIEVISLRPRRHTRGRRTEPPRQRAKGEAEPGVIQQKSVDKAIEQLEYLRSHTRPISTFISNSASSILTTSSMTAR